MAEPKRILALVPNGASTDNRVVREAESLHASGHEVLLVGLRLSNLPGNEALTAGGVKIRRVKWQYTAFSRVATIYAAILLPLLAILLAIAAGAIWYLYHGLLAPIARLVVEFAVDVLLRFGNWAYAAILWFTNSEPSSPIFSTNGVTNLATTQPMASHLAVFAVLYITYLLLRRPLNRIGRGIGRGVRKLISNPVVTVVREKARFARNYGQSENVQEFSLLESLADLSGGPLGTLQQRLSSHSVLSARTSAFVEIGRDFRPDLVHCHEVATLPAAIALKQELGCKVIYEAHEIYDDLANASNQMSRAHQAIHRACLPKVDGFVTVNEAIADYYRNSYPSLASPVVVPNSVYPKTVTYDGRLHEAAQIPTKAKILLYQGGFSLHRGLPILLEAAFRLPEDWYVVFMGKGALEQTLRDSASRLRDQLAFQYERDLIREVLSTAPPNVSLATIGAEHFAIDEQAVLSSTMASFSNGQLASQTVGRELKQLRALAQSFQFSDTISSVMGRLRGVRVLERARFVPMAPHAELVEWTSGATVGIIPYENVGLNHWNCSPNKLWEYPNAGVPILASRLHFLSQVINQWGTGWTFASDPTVAEIVAAVRAISDAELEEKRVACRRFIEADNYTLHEQRLLSLVDGLFA